MKTIIIFLSFMLFANTIGAQNVKESTRYRVTAVKVGDASIISQSNEAVTYPNIQLYIPNAFTPNGDGLNEMFGAVGEGVGEFHMAVYNRWGEKIFESNEMNNGWDGKYQGELVEIGTYTYTVEAKGIKSGYVYKKGTFNLVM